VLARPESQRDRKRGTLARACGAAWGSADDGARRLGHSPVNSYVVPIGGATPGYESEVVFSDGTFVEGSTAELSADGPLREPYVAFCQVRNPREVKFRARATCASNSHS
jgi:hypothetical protein